MKISTNFWVVVTVAMGLASIVYMFETQSALAPAFTAILLPFLVGIVGSLQGAAKSVEASKDNAAALVSVKAVADQNTSQLAAVAQQTGQGIEGITQKVNGHQSELMALVNAGNAQIALLSQKVVSLEKAAAIKAATDGSESRIIAAVQTAVSDAAALAPPTDSAVAP